MEKKSIFNYLTRSYLNSDEYTKITERRTQVDWAIYIKDLVDNRYSEAEKIIFVMDNLNTHHKASLYVAFEPAEAKRLAGRFEIHYTPKHGSCLIFCL